MWSQLVTQFMPLSWAHTAHFNVLQQKVPYSNILRQNRVIFNCFATKQCNQPLRGSESELEIARVSQRDERVRGESQSEAECSRGSQSKPERARVNQRESHREPQRFSLALSGSP